MRYLNAKQLSAKLGGRSRSSIYRDVDAGRLPRPIPHGGRNYWIEDVVDAHLEKQAMLFGQRKDDT